MKNVARIVAAFVGSLALQSGAADLDLAVAQKWAAAKVVKYRVTVEFTWDVKNRKVIGGVTLTDAKSELSNIKSDGTNCPPPQLDGDYEHFSSASSSMAADLIQINGTRTFPKAKVSNYPASCSMRAIPGGKEQSTLWVGGAAPEALGMPIMKGGPVSVAPDRKSFSVQGAGSWVWTYTPKLVQ